MITPCKNICKIDPHTEICIGCNRYVEEIEVWSILTDDERSCIMEKLKDRTDDESKKEKNSIYSVRQKHTIQTKDSS